MLLHLRVEFQFNASNVLRYAEVNLPDDALEEGLLCLRGRKVQQRVELAQQLLNDLLGEENLKGYLCLVENELLW
ncbi:hypothetical protein [Paenibacillus wynnii]|uniref:Uncharacterized protein n=1 Tax=Paenibacillus wynnii TaxID=268407 RepID=A0A098MDM1_9BACL|nr:hypothetical protein [Paenibacillus wynnii]KGE20081.1 hypothetical protein PWYN_12580 [Paenibacillus wynnii]